MIRLNKSDLVAEVARDLGMNRQNVAQTIDGFLGMVARGAAAGAIVHLHGFGIFETKDRPARIGRNPGTGAAVEIAASSKLTFRAAKRGGA